VLIELVILLIVAPPLVCGFFSEILLFLGEKKQTFTARSSTEAEYLVLADTTSKILWLGWFLADLEVVQSSSTDIYCDNQSVI